MKLQNETDEIPSLSKEYPWRKKFKKIILQKMKIFIEMENINMVQ